MRASSWCVLILLISGCASTPTTTTSSSKADTADERVEKKDVPSRQKQQAQPPAVSGVVSVEVTDVTGEHLPARVELKTVAELTRTFYELPTGQRDIKAGVGDYYAFVYVYDESVPIMVHIQELTIADGAEATIQVNMLEGASGTLTVHDYDQDSDLAIDKVELIAGTDPENPASIPGRPNVYFDERVFEEADRWYRGELHAVSTYGGGEETVAELVARAEQAGLDFLAIADLNTMEARNDPAFKSDSVVLIPALAWGTPEQGLGLIYGPATEPDPPTSMAAAQAECVRIQSQGGVFAVAHPCFSDAPWKWGLSHVNAIQVWNGPWRGHGPLRLSDLPEDLKIRENRQLVRSIAAAAAVADKTADAAAAISREDVGISANDQAALFWDYELVRGAVCSVIAGGMVDRRSVPMGQPVTWVKAPEKSVAGILQGLRQGRTFVSSGPGGVEVEFKADALNDGKIDVGAGGAVPLGIDVALHATVFNARGQKVQLLRNGHPVITKSVPSDQYAFISQQTTDFQCAYRLRVIRQPDRPTKGFGPVEVTALSSPIYAADIGAELLNVLPVDFSNVRVDLKSEYVKDDPRLRNR
jgi:hypothetical protein